VRWPVQAGRTARPNGHSGRGPGQHDQRAKESKAESLSVICRGERAIALAGSAVLARANSIPMITCSPLPENPTHDALRLADGASIRVPWLENEKEPLPRLEEVLEELGGGFNFLGSLV